MPSFSDQVGNTFEMSETPVRIVSLVPSQTELLYDLGLDESVVGITKFCVHPDSWYTSKTKIGGTKQVNIKLIRELKPDFIIANKEENVKQQVEELQKDYPVWISDISTLEHALHMIHSIGMITNTISKAHSIIDKIQTNFNKLSTSNFRLPGKAINPNTAYLIWREPYMAAGGDTFISSMMKFCGFKNVFEHVHRYPVITIEQLLEADCKLLLLSSEPYPFKHQHIMEMRERMPNTNFILADGQFFSWYGSRLVEAPGYFESLLRYQVSGFRYQV